MPVYKIWFRTEDEKQRAVFVDIDASIQAIEDAIDDDLRIRGEKISARPSEDVRGKFHIFDRVYTSFMGGTIDRIELSNSDYEDETQ